MVWVFGIDEGRKILGRLGNYPSNPSCYHYFDNRHSASSLCNIARLATQFASFFDMAMENLYPSVPDLHYRHYAPVIGE